MTDRMSEQDRLTLWTLVLLEPGTTMAEQRRRALAAYAARARRRPQVRELVGLMLAARAARQTPPNVTSLDSRRRR